MFAGHSFNDIFDLSELLSNYELELYLKISINASFNSIVHGTCLLFMEAAPSYWLQLVHAVDAGYGPMVTCLYA